MQNQKKYKKFFFFQVDTNNTFCWYEELKAHTFCPDPSAKAEPLMWVGKS